MCGIAGIVYLDDRKIDINLVKEMADTIRHRGPDDEGYLFVNTDNKNYLLLGGQDTPQEVFSYNLLYTPNKKIENQSYISKLAFAHRRLSIIDLSPTGHQPMCNEDGTIWIVYNGEIYNYQEIRKELISKGHRFISNTDTEVIIHSYEEWGIDSLQRFNGMWAFAIWDSLKKEIFCARDRFGIKPFYYYFDNNAFIFASEIKALLKVNFVPKNVSNCVIYNYLIKGYMDYSNDTFFKDIKQLKCREYLILNLNRQDLNVKPYWDINLSQKLLGLSQEDYNKQFYELFEDSVRLRLISDVSVGSCLSGGLDSSSIVCIINKLIQENKAQMPIKDLQKTFSVRYYDNRFDEGMFIEEIVKKIPVSGYQTFFNPQDIEIEIDDVIYYQDEPSWNINIYGQWCVFKLAKEQGVKVVLDGQGGDELLAGYPGYYRYFLVSMAKSFELIRLANELIKYSGRHQLPIREAIYHIILCLIPKWVKSVIKKTLKIDSEKKSESIKWLNQDFIKQINKDYLRGISTKTYLFDESLYLSLFEKGLPAMLHFEDRNSMAHSIESRLPFLDHRLVEFSFSLPYHQKISHGLTKWVLRSAMKGILPELIRNRVDKIGFRAPEDVLLRTSLKNKCYDILNSSSFKSRPFFNLDEVKKEFEVYCEGEKDILHKNIWRWINVELWMRKFIDQ